LKVLRAAFRARVHLFTAITFDRITQNPNVLAGRATIRDLRISVAHVVNLVANGMTPAQIVSALRRGWPTAVSS